jgi:uncharacterized protein
MEAPKKPGVYIVEEKAFPNSIAQVETAIPAFIGYTEIAQSNNKSVRVKPIKISSMAEFQAFFGYQAQAQFSLENTDNAAIADLSLQQNHFVLTIVSPAYRLYQSMQMFYINGGGACYVVSVGCYGDPINKVDILGGIESLTNEFEPSLLVVPEAVSLNQDDCKAVQEYMMRHCGEKMRNRFAILDVHNGFQNTTHVIGNFRQLNTSDIGSFAAAYYPWLNTTCLDDSEVSYKQLNPAGRLVLHSVIKAEWNKPTNEMAGLLSDLINTKYEINEGQGQGKHYLDEVDKSLRVTSTHYLSIVQAIKRQLNLLPPSAAMAGLYNMVDNSRGVWKAPANIALMGVISAAFNISHTEQQSLHNDFQGKFINVLRPFIGEGILVWGANTLDGNNLDWRYINARRTMIMLEQSIKLVLKAFVFEANDKHTWVTLKSMISNFLSDIWKQGGLVGSTPADSFKVCIGLGESMSDEDVLLGVLKTTVKVALSHPGEFIEVTLEQQMQLS